MLFLVFSIFVFLIEDKIKEFVFDCFFLFWSNGVWYYEDFDFLIVGEVIDIVFYNFFLGFKIYVLLIRI